VSALPVSDSQMGGSFRTNIFRIFASNKSSIFFIVRSTSTTSSDNFVCRVKELLISSTVTFSALLNSVKRLFILSRMFLVAFSFLASVSVLSQISLFSSKVFFCSPSISVLLVTSSDQSEFSFF